MCKTLKKSHAIYYGKAILSDTRNMARR